MTHLNAIVYKKTQNYPSKFLSRNKAEGDVVFSLSIRVPFYIAVELISQCFC